jgi:hypothetical protein
VLIKSTVLLAQAGGDRRIRSTAAVTSICSCSTGQLIVGFIAKEVPEAKEPRRAGKCPTGFRFRAHSRGALFHHAWCSLLLTPSSLMQNRTAVRI